MIRLQSTIDQLPESLRTKWEKDAESRRKDSRVVPTYREDFTFMVPETLDEVRKITQYLLAKQAGGVGFDVEATSTRAEIAKLVSMQFAVDENAGFYVPVGHNIGLNLEMAEVFEIMQPVFDSPFLRMAGGKYDWLVMKHHGVDLNWWAETYRDANAMSRLLGEVDYGVGLKKTVDRMFNERMIEFTDVISPAEQKKGITFADQETGLAARYATADAINTLRVVRKAERDMPESIKKFLLGIEHDAMRIAGEMEFVGMPVDMEFLERHIEAGEALMQTLYIEAIEGLKAVAERRGRKASEIPDDLNMNSSPQIKKALFDVCGFQPVKKSKKTGEPSADKASIEKMAERDPEVDWIRRYRSCESRVGDLREMRDFAVQRDGWHWVHGGLNPTGAATGRWSSSKPNLQNIPKGTSRYESRHSSWEVAPRDAIKAPPGYKIVTADYSQVELRVAAGESGCRMWIEAFANGDDVHSASGAAIYKVPISEVTAKQRSAGKTFNFALLFGQEVKSTAQQLGVSVAEAQRMQNAFWEGLPEVKSWIDRVHATVRRQKFVETKFGRRRWLRGIDDENKWVVLQNLRESVNTVVQGTAADILKIGLRRQRALSQEMGAKLFLVVHDQYVWLVPEQIPPDEFCRKMDQQINFEIPGYPEIISDYGIGERFDEYSSLVTYDSAGQVPSSWSEALLPNNSSGSGTVSDDVDQLVVEAESITMPELQAFIELIEGNPGESEVVLAVRGRREMKLNQRTSLTSRDEIRIRSAIRTSRVSST